MTENHRIYSDILDDESCRAKNFPAVSKILKLKLPEDDLKFIDTNEYITKKRFTKLDDNGFWRTASPVSNLINIPRFLELNDDFLWIIGNYIAEGYRDKYRINFASNKKEKESHDKVMTFFKKFGLKPNYNEKRTNSKNGAVIRICSSIFADILSKLCGSLAHNKHLPNIWMKLSRKQLSVLLTGYFDGDGSYRYNSIRWTSTSWQLTGQIAIALAAIGGYGRPFYIKQKQYENGRIDRPAYGCYSGVLSTAIFRNNEIPLSNQANKTFNYKKNEVPNKWKEVETSNIKFVCDIEVEDDHTFILWGSQISRNCHYSNRSDFRIQKALMAIDQELKIDDPNLFHVNSDEQFLKTRAQMRKTFYEYNYNKIITPEKFEEYCDNTILVGERCTSFQPNLDPKLPLIQNADEQLKRLAIDGLKAKGLWDDPRKYKIDGREVTHKEQLFIELNRFIEKGFSSYFLIMKDLVDYSRVNGWPVGPGRGSCAGSLACYALGIHTTPPINGFSLSFDRFLSSSRGGNLLKVTMDDKE